MTDFHNPPRWAMRRTGRVALMVVTLCYAGPILYGQNAKSRLVATYSDGANSIVQLVPTPNLRLAATESVHPQIAANFTAEWSGVLRIIRAGRYHVYARGAQVRVAGRDPEQGLDLATGEHPIEIRFERADSDAELNLRWESEFFRDEPVPSAVLGHVETPAKLAEQDVVEHGRFLFAEFGCSNCHAARDWNLQSRRGPDLAKVGARVTAGWLYEWLKDPHDYRKAAVMPVSLRSKQDRADVTAFLMSRGKDFDSPVPDGTTPEQIETGRELFDQVGCVKCHNKDNNLDTIGSKYVSANALGAFIADPHATDPHGRMPQLFLSAEERHLAFRVAQFLFHEKQRPRPYTEPPAGNATRGSQLFVSHGCANCHAGTQAETNREDSLAGPAFGQPVGLPLRHFWDFDNEDDEVTDRVTGRVERIAGRLAFAESVADRGSAFDFDGRTYIELPHFHRPDVMTITVWVKTTSGGSIITWGRPGGGQRGSRELRMNIGQDGKNSICYGEYNSDGGWRPVIVRPADVNVVDGKWHHIAIVRNGQAIQHYVDGRPQGQPGQTQRGPGDYTDRLLIGALGLQQNPSNRFTGQMDDLSVWEMALSAEQISAIAGGGSPLAMATPARREIKPFDVAAGCLADSVKEPLPDYKFDNGDRTALREFLTTVHPDRSDTWHTAPPTLHNLRIRQFRCTACHELHDQNIQKGVAVDDSGRIVRIERPPLLTGAGEKLTYSWLREVLLEKERNRPWLNLRMPHFGHGINDLPQLISAAAGLPAEEAGPRPEQSLAKAGLEMIGTRRGKVSCTACHDYRGINRRKDGVVPAPDLADAGRTVRRAWFERWMHDPQRLQPGTSMPQLFLDVSSEERDLRIARLWSALYYQKQLPLPKGVLDQQTEGTRIIVKDKPVLFRMATVTPVGRIDRAINVGLPGGRNFTFDAVTCRLRYAWRGDFIDAGPAWNGRGGNPVQAGKNQLMALQSNHAVRIGNSGEPESLRFRGYRLEEQMPVFRYDLDGARVEHFVDVTEEAVNQTIVVHGPKGDVFYVGDDKTPFECDADHRLDNHARFAKANVVKFQITIPIKKSD